MKTPVTPPEALAARKSGDGFDALLEERFGETGRREMASRIAAHDQGRSPAGFDREHMRRRIRFHGEIPAKVKTTLLQWVPELAAHAADQGLGLRDLNHEVHFFQQGAFEAAFGPVPPGVTLPASSYAYNQLYRVYTVRVVLPGEIRAISQLLAVLRAAVTRLYGDIFLREEVFALEPYREDGAGEEQEITVGLGEKIQLLALETICPTPLEHVLREHARAINLNYKRVPDQVRRDFFKQALRALEEQKLPEMREAAIEGAFAEFRDGLRAEMGKTVAELVAETERLNGQLNFLPPDDRAQYDRLRTMHPIHYLRSAKLRLNFLIEALGALVEGFEQLERPQAAASPVLEEQIEGYLSELRTQKLARPYLVPGVNLSEELARQKAAFPFEVNALLMTLAPAAAPGAHLEKAFKALTNKLAHSLHQRLYHALLLANAWVKAGLQGRGEEFRASESFATLKGLAANFRFRKPLLEALYVKMGIVVEMAESAGGEGKPEKTTRRFPVVDFGKAWGQFVPHALVAGHVLARGGVPGFDMERYWEGVEKNLERRLTPAEVKSAGVCRLALLLRRLQQEGGGDGLRLLAEILRQPTGTFRFVVAQALTPPAREDGLETPEAQLAHWAGLVGQARETTRRNAIVVGASPAPPGNYPRR